MAFTATEEKRGRGRRRGGRLSEEEREGVEEKDEQPSVRNISICWHSVPPPLHDRPSSPFEGDLQFGETITVAYVQEGPPVRPPVSLPSCRTVGRRRTDGVVDPLADERGRGGPFHNSHFFLDLQTTAKTRSEAAAAAAAPCSLAAALAAAAAAYLATEACPRKESKQEEEEEEGSWR